MRFINILVIKSNCSLNDVTAPEVCRRLHEDLQLAEHDAAHSPLVWVSPVPGSDVARVSS